MNRARAENFHRRYPSPNAMRASARRMGACAMLSLSLAALTGCPGVNPQSLPTITNATVSATPTPAPTTVSTVRAVKFIFKQAYPSGSFDAPPVNGTVPGVGTGHAAARAFGADGSLLATSPSSSSWPTWLPRLEIGISGSANTAATNPQCARFTSATEASSCNFGAGAVSCVAPSTFYRVSEFDCVAGGATNGTGAGNDGVYVRATFNRAQMSSTDNLMVVVEYLAAGYNAGAKVPTSCTTAGSATPETCSDLTWKSYLKHSGGETTQPFFMLIPPTQSFVATGAGSSSGASPISRQIILPMANDPNLTVFQLSRIGTALTAVSIPFTGACPSNSALCAGVTLYSITFYRM